MTLGEKCLEAVDGVSRADLIEERGKGRSGICQGDPVVRCLALANSELYYHGHEGR